MIKVFHLVRRHLGEEIPEDEMLSDEVASPTAEAATMSFAGVELSKNCSYDHTMIHSPTTTNINTQHIHQPLHSPPNTPPSTNH